ncbi:MAG TPA: GDSL-type esterase/lipase family protein [Caulobacteraceae bacterium]
MTRAGAGRAALLPLAAAVLASAWPAGADPAASALTGAEALRPFFAALHELKAGKRSTPVEILQIGDSHTAGDFISSGIRARLQARFGEAGRGVLPPGVPFKFYGPRQVDVTQSDGWRMEPSFPMTPGRAEAFGLSGWRLAAEKPGATVTMTADPEALFDRARVCALAQPGAAAIVVSAGDSHTRIALGDGAAGPRCVQVAFDGPQKTLQIVAEGAPTTLLSFGTWRWRAGVSVSNLGVIGTELFDFAARDDAIVKAELEAYDPQLIVLAFGANEGNRQVLDAASYAQLVRAQIRRLKRLAPGAAILLLGPPDENVTRPDIPEDGVHDLNFACAPLTAAELADYPQRVAARDPALARWYPPPNLSPVREAQRHAAAAEGVAFWDWNARMGGPCTAHKLSRPGVGLVRGDHVHFTNDGGDMIAGLLTDDLMAAYAAEGGS